MLPLAIGGTITTDRVCIECNSILGSRVDAALSDYFPIRNRRAELGIAGHSGVPPGRFELLDGVGQLSDGKRVRTKINKQTGKLDVRQLYHAADVVLPDGQKARQISVDVRDKDRLPTIIQRERRRHGLAPLDGDQLALEVSKCTIQTIDKPCVLYSFQINSTYLRHAIVKIAYELAFLWLGETYLSDPLAAELRTAVCDSHPTSTDKLMGSIGHAGENPVFDYWTPHNAHHLAYGNVVRGVGVVIAVRIFDIYAGSVVVSREPERYIGNDADQVKLRFLAIDSVSGRTIDTAFREELHRLVVAMLSRGQIGPIFDPLSDLCPVVPPR